MTGPEDIQVTTGTVPADAETGVQNQQVVIQDSSARRAWTGEGATVGEAATQAVRRLLGDRRVREYTGTGLGLGTRD